MKRLISKQVWATILLPIFFFTFLSCKKANDLEAPEETTEGTIEIEIPKGTLSKETEIDIQQLKSTSAAANELHLSCR